MSSCRCLTRACLVTPGVREPAKPSTGSALGVGAITRPGGRSGGQQQRVAVARPLATEPALLLADEPTGNLDSTATEDVLNLFAELHAQGRTVVLITHEAEVAQRAARIIRIRDGLIASDELAAVGGGR